MKIKDIVEANEAKALVVIGTNPCAGGKRQARRRVMDACERVMAMLQKESKAIGDELDIAAHPERITEADRKMTEFLEQECDEKLEPLWTWDEIAVPTTWQQERLLEKLGVIIPETAGEPKEKSE